MEAVQDKWNSYDWRVENILEDGAAEVTIFCGVNAEPRAKEFASRKVKPAEPPVALAEEPKQDPVLCSCCYTQGSFLAPSCIVHGAGAGYISAAASREVKP